MQYAPLGRSGLTVSRIAFGCMSFGDPALRSWTLPEADAQPFFRRAVELGINFFDTADVYCLGASEEITGRALKEYARREEIVIATKVGLPWVERQLDGSAPPPNRSGLSRKHIVQSCEASLKRLGIDAIDLYQVHRFDAHTPLDETLRALDDLIRAGKVRYIGASSTYAWRLMQALATSDSHGFARFVSMQNHWNLVYREEEREMVPLCRDQGLGIIPWSPLARGLLARAADQATSRGSGDAAFRGGLYDQPSDAEVVAANREVALTRGVSPAETALAWLLAQPGVTAPIVGATRLEHLETAVRALDLSLTQEEISRLESAYRPHPVRGWIRG